MKVCLKCNHEFNKLDWNCPACGYIPPYVEEYLTFAPELAAVSEGFEVELFPQLAKLEAKNFWFRSRNRLIIYAIKQYFPQAHTFLEIGCGTGFVLQGIEKHCPHLTCSGSEIFTAGLNFATERLCKTTLFQMDARQIPFKVVRVTSFISFLLPLMLISRLNNRSKSNDYDPTSELKISGSLNYFLEKILDIERWLIKLGFSFPLGGSLLVIAYKN